MMNRGFVAQQQYLKTGGRLIQLHPTWIHAFSPEFFGGRRVAVSIYVSFFIQLGFLNFTRAITVANGDAN
jgi:hypothetical protein